LTFDFGYYLNTHVQPGVRITIYLKDVPQKAAAVSVNSVFSLLQHEHKTTVLNFTLQRNTEYDGTVRSKVRINLLLVFPIVYLFLLRTPSYYVLDHGDCQSTQSIANRRLGEARVPIMSTNSKDIFAMVRHMWPQPTVL